MVIVHRLFGVYSSKSRLIKIANMVVLNERARNLIRNLEQFVLEYLHMYQACVCTIVISNECNIIYFDMNDAQLLKSLE